MKVFKNQFKFDSTRFQQVLTFFTLSTMLNDLLKRPRHSVQQNYEHMLKQMLNRLNGP